MRQFTPGNEVSFTTTFIDGATNKPTTPTTVKLKLRDPKGVETDLTPSNPSTGVYTVDFTPEVPGLWSYRWEATGTGVTAAREGNFNVNATDF